MTSSCAISLIAIIISAIAAVIAWLSWNVSRDKLRLDLYNKRFDIYSKLLDLFTKLPSNKRYDSLNDDEREDFENYEIMKQNFTKYYRESLFLFSNESGVHQKIYEIVDKIVFILSYIKSPSNLIPQHSDASIDISNKVICYRASLEGDMKELESSIGEYLVFRDYKPLEISLITRFSHIREKK